MLIDSGADVNVRGEKYGSALQAACGAGCEGVVRLLVENDAKFDAALQIASLGGHHGIVAYLLAKDADPNAQDGSFGTALQIAAAVGREEMVQVLVDRGADANGEGRHFGTALQVAAAAGNKDLVRLLLDRGADPTLGGGNFGIKSAQLLQGPASKNDRVEDFGVSALESAAAAGYDKVVQILLDNVSKVMGESPERHFKRMFNGALEAASCNGYRINCFI